MTVNSRNLVDLLVQKTGLEKDQVQEQLDLIIEHFQSEIEKGEEFQIAGLGTFRLKGEELDFITEDKLATEINYKYAGMKPIELIGAFKETPDASDDIAKNETEVSAIGPDSDVEEYSREMAPTEEEPAEKVAASSQADDIEEDEKEEEKKEVPVGEIASAEKRADSSSEPAPLSAEQTSKKGTEEKAKPETAPVKSKVRSKKKKEATDPIGKILVAAVIIVALGISGWMFYDLGYFGGDSSNNGSNVAESRVTQSLDAAPDESVNSGDNKADPDSVNSGSKANINETSEQEEQNATSSITDIAEESRQSVYGLRGGASPRVTDGYTIVVHSLRDEAKVRRLNEELQRDGYRTVISRASIMDTTFWRLGLGQFKTIEDATEASQELPDPYKSNHFIKRIQ